MKRLPILLLLVPFALAACSNGTTSTSSTTSAASPQVSARRAPSIALGGYSSADIVGTWACAWVSQGGQSVPITANMNANGTADASATNSAGETGHSHFTWSYKPTGPASGTLTTGDTGFGRIVWRGRNHAEVRRIRAGPGLFEAPYFDCGRR
ncbi:MAG TPA: hypothetical protein VIN40_02620 [Candidatus Tyrphobacter sp.]